MKREAIVLPFLALLLVAVSTGCPDPAKNVPDAQVGESATTPEPAVGQRYAITEDSTVSFVGSKVTGSHDGGFREFEGDIIVVDGDPERSQVAVIIDTTSLWADNPKLTGHLKSADFFEVEKYPIANFTSTQIVRDGEQYRVSGNLALHGVTKNVTFPAQIEVRPDAVAARAEFSIKRFDFGIAYKGKADDLIRDDVVVRFDLKAVPATSGEGPIAGAVPTSLPSDDPASRR